MVEVDFAAATSLAMVLDFNAPQPRHFDAPAAHSETFRAGSFAGDVARGASCSCCSVTLISHCRSGDAVPNRPLHLPLVES